MSTATLAWIAITAYAVLTLGLAVRGALRTKSLESFAVGNGDIHPALIGLSLTAQLTSVATFVINPGLIFHSGVAGLLGYGFAAAAGIVLGLVVFSRRFRAVGATVKALTVPSWIGARYESPALRGVFALLSMGLVAFAVLIVVALALVLSNLLGLAPTTLAIGLTTFVVAYVLIGGANAHAMTNAVQAVVMLIVAFILIGAGAPQLLTGELLPALAAQDSNLVAITNPTSLYFRNLFEVFVCNFVVGLAVVCQPHIVGKALYLKDDAQVRTFLSVAVVAGTVFLGVLLVGLYARTAIPLDTRIDAVVPTWIAATFPPSLQVLVSLGMLCAGLSTLEGILLALSGIFALDVHPLLRPSGSSAEALRFGKTGLVLVGVVAATLAVRQIADPVGGSVAIFAQYGVYLLFTASFLPLLSGMFIPAATRGMIAAAVATSVAGYLGAGWLEFTILASNPAFLATVGIFAGSGALALALASQAVVRPSPGPPVRA
ncbi:MAG: sodium:solute symporter [Deltaproteobacteria bacterium]|nr:sodium:solute symporter [Deltaproteobacteria bacterium]